MLEEDLRRRIASDADIAALVAKKSIAWGDRPQASALPAITLDIAADDRAQHMQDFQALRSTLVQADIWSADRLEARNLREAVIAAVVPTGTTGATRFGRSFIATSASTYERTDVGAIVYRERVDFTVWHASAS